MFGGFSTRDFLLAVMSTLFFGASFPFLKYALYYLPPIFLATVRALFSAIFFILFFLLIGRGFHLPRGEALSASLLVAFFSITYPNVAQNLGMVMLTPRSAATVSSIFQSTSPIFTTLLAFLFLSEPLTRNKILGATISFTGIILFSLEGSDVGTVKSATTLGGLLILSTALSYSISGIIIKRALQFYPRLELLLWSNLISVPLYAPVLALFWMSGIEHPSPAAMFIPPVLASLVVLAILVGGVAMVIWYRLLETYPISRLTYFTYLIPLFAGALSFIFMEERLSPQSIFYAFFIIAGVYLVQRPEGGVHINND